MIAAVFDLESGLVVPALTDDECLSCLECQAVFPARQVDDDLGEIVRRQGVAACAQCGGIKGFERHPDDHSPLAERRSVADIWGAEVAACGFTSVPAVLLDHLKHLGLRSTDLAILVALESHNWSINREGVFPTKAAIAREAGCGPTAVTDSLHRLERAGFLEVETRVRANGRRTSNAYTRDGLQRALTLIATNRRNDRDGTEGLDELLAELAEKGKRAFNLRIASSPNRRSESDPLEAEKTPIEESSLPLKANPLIRGRNPNGRTSAQGERGRAPTTAIRRTATEPTPRSADLPAGRPHSEHEPLKGSQATRQRPAPTSPARSPQSRAQSAVAVTATATPTALSKRTVAPLPEAPSSAESRHSRAREPRAAHYAPFVPPPEHAWIAAYYAGRRYAPGAGA